VGDFGYYCSACGAITHRLPAGMVTCHQCGHLGLRGYDRRPRRVSCPVDGCNWIGWDDGGVNDDLGAHTRRDHA
jgi:DNA-directed RNA polymerase subunit RPC12/RpoP